MIYSVKVETKIKESHVEDMHVDKATLEHMTAEAQRIARQSYAPYSKFHVGAVALLANGEMVSGSNQENAAYPSGLCAERTTVFYANAHYPGVAITHLLIYAETEDGGAVGNPITPCAACRQVLLEKENVQGCKMKVIMVGKNGTYFVESVGDLVPLSFVPDSLKGE